MCGFGVILRVWRPPSGVGIDALPDPDASLPDAWLDELDHAVALRGPDGMGRWRDRIIRDDERDGVTVLDVAMVHRRLSIIDHDGGAQPMVYRAAPGASAVAVVFNGCIYNAAALRNELIAQGIAFASDHSDTEVLLHGWRVWKEKLPERIEGMYAAVLWDAEAGEIGVLRDRFGEKPVYLSGDHDLHSGAPGELWMASSSAIGLAGLRRRALGDAVAPVVDDGETSSNGQTAGDALEASALAEWIAMGHHSELTPFAGVFQLPPGSAVRAPRTKVVTLDKVYQSGRAKVKRGTYRRKTLPIIESKAALIDRIDGLVGDAVQRRLEADVPLGCLLSGGVDSSLVAAHASTHVHRLIAVTVRMPDEAYDESDYAADVAEHVGAEHVVVEADGQHAADDLVMLIHELGLPFGDSSLLPTFWACRAAAEVLGVALSGDGGDELFLGYERYKAVEQLWAPAIFKPFRLDTLLPRTDPKSATEKAARFFVAGQHEGYRDILAIFPTPDRRRMLPNGPKLPTPAGERPTTVSKAQEYDLRWTLPGDYLRKTDTASMLAGLEVRAPLLDSALADAALALPPHRTLIGKEPKGLLKAVARKHVPAHVIDRPKMGFAIPIGRWLREDFGGLRTLLMDHMHSVEPFPGLPISVSFSHAWRIIDEHMAGKRDHSQRLYQLLVLSIWCRAVRRVPIVAG